MTPLDKRIVQTCREAAERIQSLEAELDRVRGALEDIRDGDDNGRGGDTWAASVARQALSTGER